MRPVKMHVCGAGAVQAIRHLVAIQVCRLLPCTGKGDIAATVSAIKRVGEMLCIDEVFNLHLNQVAHSRPQCRSWNRIALGKKRVFRTSLQKAASMKKPHVLSRSEERRVGKECRSR